MLRLTKSSTSNENVPKWIDQLSSAGYARCYSKSKNREPLLRVPNDLDKDFYEPEILTHSRRLDKSTYLVRQPDMTEPCPFGEKQPHAEACPLSRSRSPLINDLRSRDSQKLEVKTADLKDTVSTAFV